MPLQTSIYLDLLRFAAAMVVFFGHLAGKRFTEGLFWQFGQFMGEAVIVFFVLSGFVIAYVTHNKELTARDYFVARAARMYSVAFPALLATFVLDLVGRAAAPDLYNADWGYKSPMGLWELFSGLLFINQLWHFDVQIGSMLPYWSLGFEVWYYILCGAYLFLKGRSRVSVLILIALIVGPKILAMLPIWIFGYASFLFLDWNKKSKSISGSALSAVYIASLVGIVWYFYSWKATLTRYELGAAWLGQPGLLGDYVIGLLFSTNIVAFSALPNIAVLTTRKIAMSIQWIAGATFTVYLFHLPLAQFFVAVFPDRTLGVPLRVWLLPATFLSLLLIAEWSERNKKFWVRLFKRITDSSYLGAP